MKTSYIDRLRADLDTLAAEDRQLDASPHVEARVMAQWDEDAANVSVHAFRWWNFAGLGAVATAVVVLAAALRPESVLPRHMRSVVEAVDGSLSQVVDGRSEPLFASQPIGEGAAIRSGGGGGSQLALADGSRVEMRSHSELSLDSAADGIRIRLVSGGVIVQAARQRAGHLYVQTKDLTVSVVGTVFLVQAEEEGSRVAVIEGEVHVRHGETAQHLQPGQQVVTSAMLEPRSVREEVAWSRQAETLAQTLQAASQATSPARPEFEVADVRVSPPRPGGGNSLQMEGGSVRGGRYELHDATMVDLISTAYEVDGDAVVGGPNWLAVDRFTVVAKAPDTATPASIRLMLQSLLADRFSLTLRRETRPRPAWVLSKKAGAPKLKPAAAVDDSGCRLLFDSNRMACRNVTIDAFIAALQPERTTPLPVIDSTGIDGTWDFDIDGVDLARSRGIFDNSPMLEAIDRQLGLKLAIQAVPQPVLVVEEVDRTPTPNAPDVEARLPPDPVEFEVASIRPCEFVNPQQTGGQTGIRVSPSGQVTTGCQPLSMHISNAWNLGTDLRGVGTTVLRVANSGSIAGAPRWTGSKSFDIVAKAPIALSRPLVNDAKFRTMLRNLLVSRFKMVTHYEDRQVDVYRLVAATPRLARADPSSRTSCRSTGIRPPTVVTCQNVTIAQFVEELNHSMAVATSGRRIVDDTRLEGTWDLTLTYSIVPVPPATPDAALEPAGSVSVAQALERQLGLKLVEDRRFAPVFVIDHVEENPAEN